ncbi:MAG: hypothetical protein IJU40_06180, partial [Desulfovibrionaceae bacterium]|nr:hypothetical protein [Desulfovibrionaceae bacterium]
AGFACVLAPFKVIASVIPLLGSLVGAGTGLASFLLGLAWSLIIIAIAWIRFRPTVGALLAGIALVLVIGSYLKGRQTA